MREATEGIEFDAIIEENTAAYLQKYLSEQPDHSLFSLIRNFH